MYWLKMQTSKKLKYCMLSAIILRTVCCARGFVLRLEAKRVQNCYYCIAGFVSSMLFPEEVSLLFVFVLVFCFASLCFWCSDLFMYYVHSLILLHFLLCVVYLYLLELYYILLLSYHFLPLSALFVWFCYAYEC